MNAKIDLKLVGPEHGLNVVLTDEINAVISIFITDVNNHLHFVSTDTLRFQGY